MGTDKNKMRTIRVSYRGGPLDGTVRDELLPVHWSYYRLEHETATGLHVYFGPISGDAGTLAYVGQEQVEDFPEDSRLP